MKEISHKAVATTVLSLLVIFSFGILLSGFDVISHPSVNKPPIISGLSKEVVVNASVAGYKVNRLAGYTSPFAEVQLTAPSLARKAIADETGHFVFYNITVLPNLNNLCLVSQDVYQLPSFPTCITPPPSDRDIDIINVLLSPSISIDSPVIRSGETVRAKGTTFPNSTVDVYVYSERQSFWVTIVGIFTKNQSTIRAINSKLTKIEKYAHKLTPFKSAHAFGLPIYKTRSNSKGYFEFSLPSSSPSYNRLHVASLINLAVARNYPEVMGIDTQIDDSYQAVLEEPDIDLRQSPKSNSLNFRSLSGLLFLLRNLLVLALTGLLGLTNLSNPLIMLILIELFVIIYLLLYLLFAKRKCKVCFYCVIDRCPLPARN